MLRKAIVLGLITAAFWGSVASAQYNTQQEAPLPKGVRPAGGDLDSMTANLASSLEKITIEIERLQALQSRTADEDKALGGLLLQRAKLSEEITEIQKNAHESRKHHITNMRN